MFAQTAGAHISKEALSLKQRLGTTGGGCEEIRTGTDGAMFGHIFAWETGVKQHHGLMSVVGGKLHILAFIHKKMKYDL